MLIQWNTPVAKVPRVASEDLVLPDWDPWLLLRLVKCRNSSQLMHLPLQIQKLYSSLNGRKRMASGGNTLSVCRATTSFHKMYTDRFDQSPVVYRFRFHFSKLKDNQTTTFFSQALSVTQQLFNWEDFDSSSHWQDSRKANRPKIYAIKFVKVCLKMNLLGRPWNPYLNTG